MSDDDQMTPGPWKDCGPNEEGERCIFGADGSCVAVTIPVGNPDEREQRSIENACAIAAAPELLEALEKSLHYFDQVIIDTGYQSEGEKIAHEKARAALAKAKGENHE